MTLLAELVETSDRVAETPARLAKVRALAERLRALEGDEIAIGAQHLSGSVPQGRLGIGYAVLQAAGNGDRAAHPSLCKLSRIHRSVPVAATALPLEHPPEHTQAALERPNGRFLKSRRPRNSLLFAGTPDLRN